MKPPKFEYFAPTTLSEATALLDKYGDDAKILAGGQSLMPLMNMRLVRPEVLVDINRISQLQYISLNPDGGVAMGALTRQREVERSSSVQEKMPLIAAALPFIGHIPTRNRGTVGGSMVHGDPAAELPAISVALGAEFVLSSTGTQRVVPANDFFLGYLTTVLEATELLTEVRFPSLAGRWGWGFEEMCRREGDFAMVGAVTLVQLDEDNFCRSARITMFGVGAAPVRAERAEEVLLGMRVSDRIIENVSSLVAEALEPDSDIHASAQYRKEVGGVLARRTLKAALNRAEASASQ